MPYDLHRFIIAQEIDYPIALQELQNGRKQSHWMWYIFPQLKGLGFSETSIFYGLNGLDEASAYLRHPILGKRLINCCMALLALESTDPREVLGSPDHLKLKSSMTLFASAPGADPIFMHVLEKFYAGQKDEQTVRKLR